MSEPLVSVIIPTFNRFEYLLNAIESVKAQSYKNYEIIVINDESTQSEYYEKNFPENVNLIHIKKDLYPDWGGSRQPLRNIGAENAKGEYLAFLDDDDIWMRDKLSIQISQMLQKNSYFRQLKGSMVKESMTQRKNINYIIPSIFIRY